MKLPGLRHLSAHAREIMGYAVASAAAFAVDVSLLTVLVSRFGLHYLLATSLSFVFGGFVLYLLCIRFVFRVRRIGGSHFELPAFVALGIAGLAVQACLMYTTVELLGVHYLAAKVVAAGGSFAANFLLRRTLLFSDATAQGTGRAP